MHLDEVDCELCILDENYEIIHVFERGDLSRGAYKHMCACVRQSWDASVPPDVLWSKAEAAWDALTPEQQMLIWSLSVQEQQNAHDICTGLLATLLNYQGLSSVKNAFKLAIKSVIEQFE